MSGLVPREADPAAGITTAVICTPDGVRLIRIRSDGAPIEDPSDNSPAQANGFCPVCTALGASPLAVLGDRIVLLIPYGRGENMASAPLVNPTGRSCRTIRLRGPPIRQA